MALEFQKGEDTTCSLFICTKCANVHVVVLKKSLSNIKDGNSELNAGFRTISHANLLIHFCGFTLFPSKVAFHYHRKVLIHPQVLIPTLFLALKSLYEQTPRNELLTVVLGVS